MLPIQRERRDGNVAAIVNPIEVPWSVKFLGHFIQPIKHAAQFFSNFDFSWSIFRVFITLANPTKRRHHDSPDKAYGNRYRCLC